ncbi:MAG TPA: TolC family protein [Burkholderiales bacterium]|nr:TolC family protein [Burkholderiales bacterium]
MVTHYLLVVCLASTPAYSAPLGIDGAVELALAKQPLIESQNAAIEAAKESAVAAAQLPDPKLTLGLQDYPVSGSDALSFRRDSFTMLKAGVMQEFPREEKRRLRGARELKDAEAKAQELDLTRRTIVRDAALAWLEVYYPEQAKVLIRELEREAEVQIESAEIAYRAGRKTQADVLAEQVTLALLKDREADFSKQSAQARAGLSRWIASAASRPVEEKLPDQSPPALEALLTLVESHPHLNTLDKQTDIAQNEVALARQAYKPDWNLEVYYAARPEFSNFVGVQVGIDLPVFPKNRQDRMLASKLAQLDKTRSLKEDALRSHKADAARYYAEWQSASDRLSVFFDQDILPTARARIEAALAAYQTGRADLASVLEARRAELDLRLQRLALMVDRARALTQLQYFYE